MKSVLVIGGYGGFGARLCRRLAEDGWNVLVAGRNKAKADRFALTLPRAHAVKLDRGGDVETVLAHTSPSLVIDAAGPFQGSGYRVPQACIALGIHYLDLADARDFVTGIRSLDASARRAGVCVISGASSVPALSGAVIRELAKGLDRVDEVSMAISASDRATAGTSVAAAILSYVGKPLQLWRGQRWNTRHGWQDVRMLTAQVGGGRKLRRRVALADVPDLDVVPRELPGNPAATFHAGPEFAFQVWALWLLSWPVRWGWLRSLGVLKKLLLPMQRLTRPFSDGRSAMVVELSGKDEAGFAKRRWQLLARDGHGPEIPVMAAQLLARAVDGGRLEPGARHAGGALSLDRFDALFAGLAIETSIESNANEPLYRRVLGSEFDRLPAPVQAMHEICGDGGAHGSGRVERGKNPLARLIGAIMRFPPEGEHQVHVAFREQNGRETWTRDFGGHRFRSELAESYGKLTERFGPLRFAFDLPVDETSLRMELLGWSVVGIPLPKTLAPKIEASETSDGKDFIFDVAISLLLVGKVVHYKGRLRRVDHLTED